MHEKLRGLDYAISIASRNYELSKKAEKADVELLRTMKRLRNSGVIPERIYASFKARTKPLRTLNAQNNIELKAKLAQASKSYWIYLNEQYERDQQEQARLATLGEKMLENYTAEEFKAIAAYVKRHA